MDIAKRMLIEALKDAESRLEEKNTETSEKMSKENERERTEVNQEESEEDIPAAGFTSDP